MTPFCAWTAKDKWNDSHTHNAICMLPALSTLLRTLRILYNVIAGNNSSRVRRSCNECCLVTHEAAGARLPFASIQDGCIVMQTTDSFKRRIVTESIKLISDQQRESGFRNGLPPVWEAGRLSRLLLQPTRAQQFRLQTRQLYVRP